MNTLHDQMLAKHRGQMSAEAVRQRIKQDDIALLNQVQTDPEMRTADRRDAAAHLLSKGFGRRALLGGVAGGLILPSATRAGPVINPAQKNVPPKTNRFMMKMQAGSYQAGVANTTYFQLIEIPTMCTSIRIHLSNDQTGATVPIGGVWVAPTASATVAKPYVPNGLDISGVAPNGTPATFNNGGSFTPMPYNNVAGGPTTFTIPAAATGESSGTGTSFSPALIATDPIDIMPVKRTDGGNGAPVLVAVQSTSGNTLRTQTLSNHNGAGSISVGSPSAANYTNGCWSQTSLTAPSLSTSAGFGFLSAIYGIECWTDQPVRTVLFAGDSVGSGFGVADTRCWSAAAWGIQYMRFAGELVALYNVSIASTPEWDYMHNALAIGAIAPVHAFIYQSWSRNAWISGSAWTAAIAFLEYQKAQAIANYFEVQRIPTIPTTGAPCAVGSGVSGASDLSSRVAVNNMVRASGHPVWDFDALWTNGASPSDYAPGMAFTDDVHPSQLAMQNAGAVLPGLLTGVWQ
jgi:hypothetical protein